MQQKNYILLIVFSLVTVLLAACAKDQRLMYQQDPRIYFYESQVYRDSLIYTFGVQPVDKQKDTAFLIVRIMGMAAPYDREVHLIAVDSSTAKQGRDYDFGPLFVRAGRYQDTLPVYLYKTAAMQDSVFTLYLKIGASKDFKPRFQEDSTSVSGSSLQNYKISITDQLTQPTRWASYASWFGAFTKIKFQFMIVSTGKTDWESSIFPAELNYLAQQVKAALVNYENANGPLIDEFGNQVVFP